MLSSFGSLEQNLALNNMPLRRRNCELDIRSFAPMRHCHDPADIRISQPKNRNPGFGPTQNGGCAVPCPHQLTIHQRAREGAIKNAAPLPLVSGPLWHVMYELAIINIVSTVLL